MEKNCGHKDWVPAGYPENANKYIRVQSIYEVFCKDCRKYIDLLTGENIDYKNLIIEDQLCSRS